MSTTGLMSAGSGHHDKHDDQTIDHSMRPGTSSAVPAKRNAFAALMSPSKSSQQTAKYKSPKRKTTATPRSVFPGREGLGAYLASPSSFPPDRVLYATPTAVAIRDLFPKSSVHLLLLPRDETKTKLHPFEALDGRDPAFLAQVRKDAAELKKLAAKELQRLFGRDSAQEQARQAAIAAALDASDDDAATVADLDSLPPGRDWEKELMVGIHAEPSMAHLHIHVISVDRVSPALKHRKHYNSFATPFFVQLDEFPLAEDDPRRQSKVKAELLMRDFECWRCGKMFGDRFAKLNEHLEHEFEDWKKL